MHCAFDPQVPIQDLADQIEVDVLVVGLDLFVDLHQCIWERENVNRNDFVFMAETGKECSLKLIYETLKRPISRINDPAQCFPADNPILS